MKNIQLPPVLIMLFANLLISSSIFAQEKTITKESTMKADIRKESTKTGTIKAMSNEQIKPNQLNTPTYSVGDFAHGGIVFYVDRPGDYGLVCAKTDQSKGEGIRWWAGTNIKTGASGKDLYQGKNNTQAIIRYQGDGDGSPYAALICDMLEITEGGVTFSDWYLPSINELDLMIKNNSIINETAIENGGSAFTHNYYWSSSESDLGLAWCRYYEGTSHNVLPLERIFSVRAVRRFKLENK